MRYLCLVYLDKARGALPTDERQRLDAHHFAFEEELRESGHLVAAEALQPGRASACVRVRDGRTQVMDGPIADTPEQMAGFYFIEAHDLNEAIRVASRLPSARLGTIEVHPTRRTA